VADARAACPELKERRVWLDCREKAEPLDQEETMDHQAVLEIAEKMAFLDCQEESALPDLRDNLVLTVFRVKKVTLDLDAQAPLV